MSESTESPENGPNPVVKVLQILTPGFIRRSFAIKFGLVLVIMGLSIGAIGLAATQVLVDQTEENAEAEFQGVASQQADVIEQWIESNSQQVRLLSANPVWASDEATELEITLENEQQGLAGEVNEMHIIDVEVGPIVTSSTSLDSGTTFAAGSRQWVRSEFSEIQELGLDDIYVSDTYEEGDERVVAFVSPTAGVDNRFLMVEVSVFEIQQSLRGALQQDVGFTQVVNTGPYQGSDETTNNVMIDARGEAGKLLETYATSESALEPLQLANELRGDSEPAGVIARMSANDAVLDEEYTVGYAPIEVQQEDSQATITQKDWVVVTHGPRSEVFGLVDTLSQWGLIVTGVAVLLIGITGSTLGYSTSASIDRLTKKTDEMREGNLDVNLYTSRVDNIGRLYDGFADMRDALQQQIQEAEESRQEAESARKEAEVARAEAEELANYLQEKAEEYSGIMQQVSAGDLTQRMTQDGEEESMDRIAEEFNEMIGELEKTTGQLKGYVDEVEEAGSEVEQSAGTVRKASEQVADSIQKISDDAYDQKERLQQISETLDQIIQDVDDVTEEYEGTEIEDALGEIESIATDINEIVDLSQETMAEAENVAGAAEEQAAELNEVSERANDLQRYAAPLRDILGRFETEAEHEFVFSVGPTGGAASPGSSPDEDEQ
jgi:methyl-accepting chemotaxis protein